MDRSANMRAIRSCGMKPEMTVRRIVYGLGIRYRLHTSQLAGKPDLVFPGMRKVIFVHGCFWHQHSIRRCSDGHMPKSNVEYWNPKLKRNVERDKENVKQLKAQGWAVLVIWECETKDLKSLTSRLIEFLGG